MEEAGVDGAEIMPSEAGRRLAPRRVRHRGVGRLQVAAVYQLPPGVLAPLAISVPLPRFGPSHIWRFPGVSV